MIFLRKKTLSIITAYIYRIYFYFTSDCVYIFANQFSNHLSKPCQKVSFSYKHLKYCFLNSFGVFYDSHTLYFHFLSVQNLLYNYHPLLYSKELWLSSPYWDTLICILMLNSMKLKCMQYSLSFYLNEIKSIALVTFLFLFPNMNDSFKRYLIEQTSYRT